MGQASQTLHPQRVKTVLCYQRMKETPPLLEIVLVVLVAIVIAGTAAAFFIQSTSIQRVWN
jgi:hypothetical protein